LNYDGEIARVWKYKKKKADYIKVTVKEEDGKYVLLFVAIVHDEGRMILPTIQPEGNPLYVGKYVCHYIKEISSSSLPQNTKII
jgi:hypothetical protein